MKNHIDVARVRVRSSAAAPVQEESSATLQQLVRGMIELRKSERDFLQILDDPTKLPGYDTLPTEVQAMAEVDPETFWIFWQLHQRGVNLAVIAALAQELDAAMAAAGDRAGEPASDEVLARAEELLLARLGDLMGGEAEGGSAESLEPNAELSGNGG